MSDMLFEMDEPFHDETVKAHACTGEFCQVCHPGLAMVRDTEPRKIARRNDPSTSKRAAEKARYRSGTHKALILQAHGRHPDGLTDEESAPASGLTYHQAERRCCDLRNEGMLTILKDDAGREVERQGTSGSWMRVSVLTDLGIATLAAMKEHDVPESDPVPVHTPDASPACPDCGDRLVRNLTDDYAYGCLRCGWSA